MAPLILAASFGLAGGFIRALVGIIKHRRSEKSKFRADYFVLTLIISATIGMFLSLAFATNYIINLAVGYAGIDLLENLLKIVKKKN